MKVTLLTQWFDPEPTFKGLLFAKTLKQQGYDVEVITGFPNYPGGQIYPGYKMKLYQREVHDGVIVHRLPLYPSHDRSARRRIYNYMSFMITSFLFMLFKLSLGDVIYVYHPPMTVGFSAALASLFRRKPFVYDIQDLWPDTLRATGMIRNEKVLNIVGRVCDFIYKRAAKVVVLSPGFEKRLIDRGVPAEKIEVIYNWCDEEALRIAKPFDLAKAGLDGKFNVVFAGTMGKAQALESVLEASALVAQRNPRVQFVFVGGGIEVPHLQQMVAERKLTNVRFLPRMEMTEVGGLLAAADALLVHLKRDPLFEITIPSKTQAYLAIGRPVLMAVEGDAAQLVRQSGAGLCVVPESASDLADAVLKLSTLTREELVQMGQRGRDFYDQTLSLESGVRRFSQVFQRLLGDEGSKKEVIYDQARN